MPASVIAPGRAWIGVTEGALNVLERNCPRQRFGGSEATWWDTRDTINPADDDQGDALVWRLWATARDQVALPTLDDSIDHSPSTEEYR